MNERKDTHVSDKNCQIPVESIENMTNSTAGRLTPDAEMTTLIFPSGQVEVGENRVDYSTKTALLLLHTLSKRLTQCEDCLGDIKHIKENILWQETYHENSDENEVERTNDTDGDDESYLEGKKNDDDWRTRVVKIVKQETNVAQFVSQLHLIVEEMLKGKLSEFNRGLERAEAWLQDEDPHFSQVLLTLSAKKTYLLLNEKRIRDTVDMIQKIQNLITFINPESLQDILKEKKSNNKS